MPVLKITVHDILTQRLRLALEQVAKCDIDPDEDLPDLRRNARAELREILALAASAGYSEADLCDEVISIEQGRADFEAEPDE
jgi:hypothetical protein